LSNISDAATTICCEAIIAPHKIRGSIVQKRQPYTLPMKMKIVAHSIKQSGYVYDY
jgi:hypothetical protein